MKTIGIADFEKLVMERLANPRSFAGKSLLLWNEQPLHDGSISYNVVRQCCIKHNIANPDKQVWVKYSDTNFYTDNITSIFTSCEEKNIDGINMYGNKKNGILYNSGCFGDRDRENWLKFINTHINSTGQLSEDWPLIACVRANFQNLTENLFAENCDIYDLKPTLEEWAQWLSKWCEWGMYSPILCDCNLLSSVLKYIDNNGFTIGFYWWNCIITEVAILMAEYDCETVDQIPEGELESKIQGYGVSDLTGRYLSLEEKENLARQLRLYCK